MAKVYKITTLRMKRIFELLKETKEALYQVTTVAESNYIEFILGKLMRELLEAPFQEEEPDDLG